MQRISFLGDIICQIPFLKAAQKRGNDFYTAFSKINSVLNESDFVVANLETPIAGEDSGYSNELYSFNTPAALLDSLKKLNIDLYLTVNNHCLDRGVSGLKNTLLELDKRGMKHTGTSLINDNHSFFQKKIGNTSCAFLAYTSNINEDKWDLYKNELNKIGLNQIIDIEKYLQYRTAYREKNIHFYKLRKKLGKFVSHSFEMKIKNMFGIKVKPVYDNEPLVEVGGLFIENVKNTIHTIKEKNDIVFLLPHCGGQFNTKPGNLSKEIFIKLFNFGADAVIGGHPHTIQDCGYYDNKPYAYSLGNVSTSSSYFFSVKESLPEYGMIFHTYIESNKIIKSSFTLIKMIEDKDHYITIYPIDELAKKLNKDQLSLLKNDVSNILGRISGISDTQDILREYELTTKK